jgi:uncharacterized protein (DUF302 family)
MAETLKTEFSFRHYISLLLTKVTQAGMELFVETHRSENSDNDS